jgi:hypothetical protein
MLKTMKHQFQWLNYILCLWLLSAATTTMAQNTEPQPLKLPQTAQIWTSASAKFDINDKMRFVLSTQLRADNKLQYPLDRLFIEPSLRYDLPKGFEWRGGYRYGQRWGQKTQHRFWTSVFYKPNLGKHWDIKLNSLLQTDLVAQKNTSYDWRPQIDIAYKTSKKAKIIPEIGAELFYTFNYQYHTITRYRLSAGCGYNLNKSHSLSIKYIYQRYVNIGKPQANHILSIGYDVNIDLQPKKKAEKTPSGT